MKGYEGVHVEIHISLPSAVVGDEWSVSRLGRFTPGERSPSTHWIGGWVGPRVTMDNIDKKIFLTLSRLELDPSVVQHVASRYTNYVIPAPH
jgi:hypothetical protein